MYFFFFFFSSRRRHTRSDRDWSSDVCSSDLTHDLRAHLGTFDGFTAARSSKCRQSGERRSLLEETGILAVAKPTRCKRRSRGSNLRSAAAQVDHGGVLRSHFGGRFFVFFGDKPEKIRRRAGEAAGHVGALDNPQPVRIFGTCPESGVVGLNGADQRLAGLAQGLGILRPARPEIYAFVSCGERCSDVSSGDDKRIGVLEGLWDANCSLGRIGRIFSQLLVRLAAAMNQEITGDAHDENPRLRWHAAGGEHAALGEKFRAPALRGEEKCVGSETEGRFVGTGPLVFTRETQSVLRGNPPALREGEKGIAWIVGRGSEGKSGLVPLRAGIRKMETAAARETQLKGSERLVSRVFELIDPFDSNDGLRRGNELYGDLLFDNGVAGAQRGRTTGRAISGASKQQANRRTASAARFQSTTIVARDTNSRKKAMTLRGSELRVGGQRALRPRTRTKPVPA